MLAGEVEHRRVLRWRIVSSTCLQGGRDGGSIERERKNPKRINHLGLCLAEAQAADYADHAGSTRICKYLSRLRNPGIVESR